METQVPSPTPVALVLGASGAIGGAVARRLAAQGYRLGLHAFQHAERCADLLAETLVAPPVVPAPAAEGAPVADLPYVAPAPPAPGDAASARVLTVTPFSAPRRRVTAFLSTAPSTEGAGAAAAAHPAPPPAPEPAHRLYVADLREQAQVERLAKEFLSDFGRLDALVWAAGRARDGLAARLPDRVLRETLALDLTAPFLLCKAFTRTLLRQHAGAVVFLASHAGLSGRRGGSAYALAQSGLVALAKSLAREWGASGIRVNVVVPPFLPQTGMGQGATDEFKARVHQQNALRSVPGAGAAPDPLAVVAASVMHVLACPTATGQVFILDGRITV